MPPSYSMMLPGRMSTPLIFMIAYLLRLMKEPPRTLAAVWLGPLAAGLFPGKHGVWIDRRALPPALTGSHRIDGHVKVRTGSACIAGVADTADDLATLHLLALGKARRI